jgi:LPXTG-site transpeptidase (sortase) family protein
MPPTPETEQKNFLERIFAHKTAFLIVFFIVFIVTYGILFALDLIPEPPEENEATEAEAANEEEVIPIAVDPYPQRMFIDALDKEVAILNPESRAIPDLDIALLSGVVRHPDSADFADEGNMFLFGHSSYLPNVFNKNFQAFNDIQKLVWGDVIRIQSSDTEYRYRVSKVYKTKASETTVALDHDSAKLTLVTCDSFGSKDERFVVEADLIETKVL